MAIEIKVPTVGESINEVTLVKWLKADGEWADRDEVIAELESEKATRNKAGYGSSNINTEIENTKSKLNNYINKKFLTADEASKKQAAMINRKKGGVVKIKKKK